MQQAQRNIAAEPTVHSVILSLEESPDLDSTSLEALHDFYRFVTSQNKRLLLARLKGPVFDLLQRVAPTDLDVPSFSALSVDEAVRMAQLA